MFFPFERAGEVLHAWTELVPDAAGRADDLGDAAAVPGRAGRAGAGARRLVHRRLRRLPRQRGAKAAPSCGPCATWARPWTPSPMVPPAALGDMAMDPPDPLPVRERHRAAERSAERGRRRPRGGGRPGVRIAAGDGAAAPAGRRPRAPVAGRRGAGDPAGHAQPCSRSAFPRTRRRRRPRGRTSTPSSAPSCPTAAGDYPNFVEEPADASALLRRGHLGPPAPGEGALRPERPVQGQPPHPARR